MSDDDSVGGKTFDAVVRERDALAAELARCRSANVYDGAAHKRVAELEAALRRADDIEHSISAEDWYKERDALLATSETEVAK